MRKHISKASSALLCMVLTAAIALFVPATAFANLQTAQADFQSAQTRGAESQETEVVEQAAGYSLLGIDVSEHNGNINWSTVATKVKFAIVRCGFGNNSSRDDYRWLNNAKGCLGAGIPMGVYHYSYAKNASDARSEAQHAIRSLKAAGISPGTLSFPVYYDMEDNSTASLSPAVQKSMFDTFKATLNASGYAVGLYGSRSWFGNQLSTVSLGGDYRWIANWGVSGPFVGNTSLASKGCGVWQYSSNGSVAGISGRVDMNYARSDIRFMEGRTNEYSMFRLYNPNSGEHLYTHSSGECIFLESIGWRYEGVAWRAPKSSGIPVYRVYNPYTGDHHYTTSLSEKQFLVKIGWRDEGVGWYSAWVSGQPIYRLFNPNARIGSHHYTTSASERDYLAKIGWRDEKVGWYGNK